MDIVDFIMRVEDGGVDHEELVEGVQKMIDSGLVGQLQGTWGRLANYLIASGDCHA
jgi:hypothetical protein